ncbi:hypothetical protein CO157_04385 [Candidatus Peregrinibacteria bacterium CG_4_9_14_3_um_filter_49_12]|nr:MAG: hypothetical protein CO157_04385 [Candidatus Peregrinibacteria bacterium CG_4_9_14_3_um_filter_49_12]
MIGGAVAVLGFVVSFCITVKLLIVDGWDGISNTAGASMGNMLGWVFIYGFLALITSLILFAIALPIFYSIGCVAGWLYGKSFR